jgi:hypothetical protein
MSDFLLYSTEGCHLCEDAQALLRGYQTQNPSFAWTVVDIANDDDLFARYGWLIPVLRAPRGGELRWPFDAEQLLAFMEVQ